MSIVPVIGRELRSQARQPLTFLLRLVGAGAVGVAFWLAFSSMRMPEENRFGNLPPSAAAQQQEFQNFGVALFGKINLTIFAAIWLLTPLAAADSISRERREGTLALLQLTRLRPWEIVLGKSFVHMLRSSTLFLTMAPWLLIPFLFGGLSLEDFRMAMILDLSALFLAQAAGLLASTLSRDWLKAVIWAEALALALMLGMMSVYESVLEDAYTNGSAPPAVAAGFGGWRPPRPGLWGQSYQLPNGFIEKRSLLLGLITNGTVEYQSQWLMNGNQRFEFKSKWQELWTNLNPHGEYLWFRGVIFILAGALLVFLVSLLIGAACVRRTWRESGQSASLERLRQKYFTPKYGTTILRQRLSRSLSRNPIGWLHHYSPSARLIKWTWCLVLIGVELFFVGNVRDLYTVQTWLGFLLLLGVLFSSTGSFRNELETGAFELLLVTPIREGQIVLGRVGGIWRQFLPAFVLYAAGALFLASGWSDRRTGATALESVMWIASLFFVAPFIGLYFSLLRWNFLVAWLCAALVVLAPPVLFQRQEGFSAGWTIAGQLGIAGFFCWRIRSRLQNRLALSESSQKPDLLALRA